MFKIVLISFFSFSVIATLFEYRVTKPLKIPYSSLNGYTLQEVFETFEDSAGLSITVHGNTITYASLDNDLIYSPLYNTLFYYLTTEQKTEQMQEFIETPYYFMFSALDITIEKSIIDQYYFIYLDLSDSEWLKKTDFMWRLENREVEKLPLSPL